MIMNPTTTRWTLGILAALVIALLLFLGHADRIGGDTYNLQLSKRRAEAVRAYLIGKGIDAGRIRAEARGEGMAVTGEACKNLGSERRTNQKLIECLQRDRRVEVTAGAAR